jgi:regulator of replication initiation timing
MDELFQDNKLGQLEEKIDGLIQTYRGIKEDREKLSGRVEILEAENRDLKTRMADMQSQNEGVMQKVKSILEKVEQIEV